ncbi:MAG: VWA domain-containing protein [Chloroflexi bacterium]|nr:VWA domain-containing protein [Chloroflexota bacterium]
MAYSAEISRANPSCFLFVIDQSGSMSDPYPAMPGKPKANGVSDAINKLLQDLVVRCAKEDIVRDYFHIGVIGYGAQVGPAFSGALAGKELVPISEVATAPRIEERSRKVDDGAGGLVEETVKFPVWFDPVAKNGTPMCHALTQAAAVLRGFLGAHPDCFPPVVMHFTDGESTDGDPTTAMRELTSLSTSDGNVLLFNCHISSSPGPQVAFPNSSEGLPDQYAMMLYNNASELTPFMLEVAKREHGFNLQPGAKCFTFNSDQVLVVQALDIGTRVNLR